MKTKKVKQTGRFGSKYGKKVRDRVVAVEEKQRKKQKCPYCKKFTAKRIAKGIFRCTACKNKFTSRAYYIK